MRRELEGIESLRGLGAAARVLDRQRAAVGDTKEAEGAVVVAAGSGAGHDAVVVLRDAILVALAGRDGGWRWQESSGRRRQQQGWRERVGEEEPGGEAGGRGGDDARRCTATTSPSSPPGARAGK